jgi:hypothetical protein
MASVNTAELEVKVREIYHNHVTTHNRTYDPSNGRDRRSLPDSPDGVAKPASRRSSAPDARRSPRRPGGPGAPHRSLRN